MTNQQIVNNLKGVFPPVVTPFNRRGDVDEERFRKNLQKYAGTGLAGVVVAACATGATGAWVCIAADPSTSMVIFVMAEAPHARIAYRPSNVMGDEV